jgi:hypothetical protein
MPVPTHRADCQTRLWETTCHYCGDVVYFFSCSCGSKVFFDLNHPPWNPHEERCIPYLIHYLRNVEHSSPDHIWERITGRAATLGIPVPPGTRDQVYGRAPPGQARIQAHEIRPSGGDVVDVEGQIMSIDDVNFFRRFNYTDNAFGRAFLGTLLDESYVEILLREDPDEETGFCRRFTFFVPQSRVRNSRLSQHSHATANLRSHRVGDRRVWVAASIGRP